MLLRKCAKALFRLDPENPRVMQDILEIYGSDRYDGALRELVRELMNEYEREVYSKVVDGVVEG